MLSLSGTAAAIGLAGCCSGGQAESDGGSESTEEHSDSDGHNETESHDDSEDEHSEEEESHDDEEEVHGEDSHHDEEIGAPTETAQVNMITTDGTYHFDPHVARVEVGGTVTFHNESGSHSATAYHPDNDQPQLVPDGAASWDSSLLSEAGATFEHTFETEGVYTTTARPTKRSE